MKNTERQKSLDYQKWEESKLAKADLSGKMIYCEFCETQKEGSLCNATQEEREQSCLCAKAYNRMVGTRAKRGVK